MGLSQSCGMSLRLEQSQRFPSSIVSFLDIDDGSLEQVLEDVLVEVARHKEDNPKGNGGNLFDTPAFTSIAWKYSGKENTNPAYAVEINGEVKIESLRDFSGVQKVLDKFHVPEGEPSRNLEQNFTHRFRNALNWKVGAQEKIVRYVLETQKKAIESGDAREMKPLDYQQLGEIVGCHETTIGRLCKGLIVKINEAEVPISDFVMNNNSGLIEFKLQEYILSLARRTGAEYLDSLPMSDMKIAKQYQEECGEVVARRTVNKARNKLSGLHLRVGKAKPHGTLESVKHWDYDRDLNEEDTFALISGRLPEQDVAILSREISEPLDKVDTPVLWYQFVHGKVKPEDLERVKQEIDSRANVPGSYSVAELQDLKFYSGY